jgi:hypothetical protein
MRSDEDNLFAQQFKGIIASINDAQAKGIIEKYAMGGAVAASYYLEPVSTQDVDIFVHTKTSHSILDLGTIAIFDFFKKYYAAKEEAEGLFMGGWLVQFLPPTSPLVEDGMAKAYEVDLEGEPLWIFRPEHLAAIALEVGRYKDKIRLDQFLNSSEDKVNKEEFLSLVTQFGLTEKWEKFQSQFLGG